jgi:hypothetical protein
MPDPRNIVPRTRQVIRHTTDTAVPAPAAGAVSRSAAAVLRRDALTRTPELPRDPGNENPPSPEPPTGDHGVHELAAGDTSTAEGTGQPDEDDKDKDKEERARRLRREEDSDDQDANAKSEDDGAAKDPDPDDEKPDEAKG